MQLTKDEIYKLAPLLKDGLQSFAAALIEADVAKSLKADEVVAWANLSLGFDDSDRSIFTDEIEAKAYSEKYAPLTALCRSSTVAALAARVAELEDVIDSVLLDIDDDGVAEAQDIAILAMRNIRNGRPQYEGLDAALAAKGQA